MRLLPALMLSAAILASGCAATQRQASASYEVVAASASIPPVWLKSAVSEDAETMFFVGCAEGARDLSRGEDQAESHAKTLIYAALRRDLQRQFDAALHSKQASDPEALDHALTSSLERLDLAGAVPVNRYWERLAVPVDDGVTYAYRLSLRFKMPKSDFARCRAQAYEQAAIQLGLNER